MGDPWSRTRLVGRQYYWLLHRSAGARRRARDAALLPRSPLRRVVRVGNRCRPLAQIKSLRHSQHIRNKSTAESILYRFTAGVGSNRYESCRETIREHPSFAVMPTDSSFRTGKRGSSNHNESILMPKASATSIRSLRSSAWLAGLRINSPAPPAHLHAWRRLPGPLDHFDHCRVRTGRDTADLK